MAVLGPGSKDEDAVALHCPSLDPVVLQCCWEGVLTEKSALLFEVCFATSSSSTQETLYGAAQEAEAQPLPWLRCRQEARRL